MQNFCAQTQTIALLTASLAMTDNDPTPPSPRLHLPDRLKIGLQRLRLEALESLQNLRAYEYRGTTLNRTVAIKSPTNGWPTVHRSTLEDLLRVIFEYYRRLHDENDLKKAVLRLFATDIPIFLLTLTISPSRRHMSAPSQCIAHSTWTSVLWRR